MSGMHSPSLGLLWLNPLQHAQLVCLRSPGWLHSPAAAVLAGCPRLLPSPTCSGSLLHLGCTFTNTLSCALFRDSSSSTQYEVSASPHDPFKTSTPAPLGRLLLSSARHHQRTISVPLKLSFCVFCVLTWRKHSPGDFTSVILVSSYSQLILTSNH